MLLEAMAAGTPVLALKATGTEDIVIDGVNGYMTQLSGENDTEIADAQRSFAQKLMDILEKKELNILRQGAADTAWDYESGNIAGRAEEYYQAVLWEYQKKNNKLHRNQMVDMVCHARYPCICKCGKVGRQLPEYGRKRLRTCHCKKLCGTAGRETDGRNRRRFI